MIEISHISTDEMTVNDLTKTLLSNKFKEFIKLIRISRIEASNSEASDGEASNSEPNDGEPNNSDKNNKNFVANYYKEAGEEAEAEEVSFEAEEAG